MEDSNFWSDKGFNFVVLGNCKEAIKCFDKALEIDLNDIKTWHRRGSVLYNSGLYEEAVISFDRVIALDKNHINAWYCRGQSLGRLGFYKEALFSFNKLLLLDKEHIDAWYFRGYTLWNLGSVEEALFSFNRALQIDKSLINAWYYRGLLLSNLSSHKEAIVSFDRVISLDENHIDALCEKGISLGSLGCYENALKSFDKALMIDSKYFKVWHNRGVSLSFLERYEEAVENFDKALEIDSDNFTVWFNRGLALGHLDRHEESLSSFEQALRIKPDSNDALCYQGKSLNFLERHEEAITSFEQALIIEPTSVDSYYGSGESLASLNRYEEAVSSFDQALENDSEHFEAWHNRGAALRNMDRFEEAIISFDKALEINPASIVSLFSKGSCLADIKSYEEAIILYEKATEIDENSASSWYNRGNSLRAIRRYKEAILSYEKAIKIMPKSSEFWHSKGAVLLDIGCSEEAISSFDTALSIDPNHDFLPWFGRSSALAYLRRDEEAIANLDKSLEIKTNQPLVWIQRGTLVLHSSCYREFPFLMVGLTAFPASKLNQTEPLLDLRGYEGQIQTLEIGLKHFEPKSEGWIRLKHALGNAHFTQAKKEQLEPGVISITQTYFNKARACYNEALKAIGDEISELRLEIYVDLIKLLYNRQKNEAAQKYVREATDCLNLLIDQAPSPHIKKQLSLKFSSLNQLSVIAFLDEGQPIKALETADRDKNACLEWFFALQWKKLEDISSPTWANLQPLLKPDTAIIYWHHSLAGISAFILTSQDPDQPQIHRYGYPQTQKINQWIANWQADYQSYRESNRSAKIQHPWRTNLKNTLSELAQLLQIQAILPKLSNAQRILLIPHQTLHLLPLHSLFPDRYLITYLPSLQAALQQQKQQQQSQPHQPSSGYFGLEASADLPLAHLETQLISQQFTPHTVLPVQDTFTLADFSQTLAQNQGTFHYSGHGIHNGDRPTHSAFQLTKTKTLTALELYQHCDFSHYPRVILSSCELALTGKADLTAEYIGLGSSILAKGSRCVISPLWKVSELTCLFLMLRLFELLNDSDDPRPEPKRMSEKWQTVLHSAPLPPKLGGSETSKSPNLGDLGGECRVLDTSQTSSEALRTACQWLKLVTVAELKERYSSQLQAIETSLAARQVRYQQQSEAAEKSGDRATELKAGREVIKIEDVIKELKQLLQHPDNNHQPFNAPYHYSAFICQGLA